MQRKMRRHILNRTSIYKASIYIAGFLPVWALRGIGRLGAFLSYVLIPSARENVRKNLMHLHSDHRKVNRLARKIFLNYGDYVADWAKLNHADDNGIKKWFGSIEGKEVIDEGLKRNNGIILLTAHLGNWELGGLFFGYANIPINVITAQDDMQGIAEVRENSRKIHNVKTITMNNNAMFFLDIINCLKNNEIVAMLMDRYREGEGVLVDFFGSPMLLPVGPVRLAKCTGAAVVPAFVVLDEDGKYRAVADSIVDMVFTDNNELDIKVNTEKIARVFERYILKYSDQWYNFTYLWGTSQGRKKK